MQVKKDEDNWTLHQREEGGGGTSAKQCLESVTMVLRVLIAGEQAS